MSSAAMLLESIDYYERRILHLSLWEFEIRRPGIRRRMLVCANSESAIDETIGQQLHIHVQRGSVRDLWRVVAVSQAAGVMAVTDWKMVGLLHMNAMGVWVILPTVRTQLEVAGWGCGIGLSLCLVHYSS